MARKSPSPSKWVLALLAVASLLVIIYFLDVQELFQVALAWISDLGPWGPVFFIVLYILATVLFLPGLIPTMAAGLLFGVLKGTLLVSISSISGATIAFLIGRYLAREWVAGKIQGNQKFEAIDEAVAQEGWKNRGINPPLPHFPLQPSQLRFRCHPGLPQGLLPGQLDGNASRNGGCTFTLDRWLVIWPLSAAGSVRAHRQSGLFMWWG